MARYLCRTGGIRFKGHVATETVEMREQRWREKAASGRCSVNDDWPIGVLAEQRLQAIISLALRAQCIHIKTS